MVIQPGGTVSLTVTNDATGPSRVDFGVSIVEKEIDEESLDETRIGGDPAFMQGEEYPEPKSEWLFLMQIDSCSLPFEVNFGDAGIAYVFVNKTGTEGKFLWQCG